MKITNFINSSHTETENYIDNINPATGETYGHIPSSTASDVEKATEAAKNAFKSWSSLSKQERSKYLHLIADDIEANLEDYARAESIDNGKPIILAREIDIPRSIANFRFFADEILKFEGEKFNDQGMGLNQVHYSPLGVVGCISPWNLPLYLFSWKVAPALAAGCTVVAKPSEVTPMTAYMLGLTCERIGLPPGVLNIVHGLGQNVGDAISRHPDIVAISFTGSTMTGQKIAIAAAPLMKPLHLEMGGKNPNIIFNDCDFEAAINGTLRAAFANQGQICLCGSRIMVEKELYPKFRDELVKRINKLVQGDPLNEQTEQGAVVSKAHFDKIISAIELAKKEGGKILTGGAPLERPGYYIQPTLIEGLGQNCQTNQEEIFGPVATICPFETVEEVIEMANATKYGLAGSIWSKDITKAQELALQIDSGILWINTWLMRDLRTPFGGMKESGRGREGGQYILKFFSQTKNICLKE